MIQTIDQLRKCGIGEKLLSELKAWAKGSRVTELFTWEATDRSRALLMKAGFRKRRDGWYLDVTK